MILAPVDIRTTGQAGRIQDILGFDLVDFLFEALPILEPDLSEVDRFALLLQHLGDLTANPIEFIIRRLGVWGLRLLLVTLAITPVAKLLRQPRLIRYRRTVGLWAFTYVALHLSTYIGIDQFFDWRSIGKDIVKRP